MKFVRRRLTYANVMSSIAVFLVVAGGSALAANQLGKNTVGSKQLKKNAVTAAKIKNGAVTGAKLKLSSIGKVPSATTADTATSANTAKTADSAGSAANAKNAEHALTADSVSNVHVFKAGAVAASPSEATAPKVELGSVGPFNFYGKCFSEAGNIREATYIELTSGVATLGSEGGARFESTEYLSPGVPESKRIMKSVTAAANNFNAGSFDEEFQASASDGTEITGLIGGVGAKEGNPAAGNGPFLAVDSCLVGAIAVFGG
jgi:hypothetical protein